jgi:2-dehydropantoate 2-reductase
MAGVGRQDVIAVLGSGAVGALIGAQLTRAGIPTALVTTEASADAIGRDGVTVDSPAFGEHTERVAAVTALEAPPGTLVVAVKAPQLAGALDRIAGEPDVVVPLLNGVDHMTVLHGWYSPKRIVAGAIRVESTRVAPGVIEQASPFCMIELASDAAPRAKVDAVRAMLEEAGFAVTVRASEAAVLWDKLAFLAPLALLTTHAGEPVGVVRTARRGDLEAVVGEVARVAVAEGGSVDPKAVMEMFDFVSGDMKSSMQRDAEAGRPLELDAIGGAVLRGATRHGFDVPVVTRIIDDLHSRRFAR